MPVDLEPIQEIHKLETEVDQARAGVKQRKQYRVDLIEALPQYQALEEARAAVEAPKAKLKIAVRDNRELAKLDVDIAEVRFDLRDLRQILGTGSFCTRSRPARL
jgi:hypothetical protein